MNQALQNHQPEKIRYGEVAEAVVIGGMILDIHATPSIPPIPRTTTPGKVIYTMGGVARNVAECMAKLGEKPYMISAVGLDMAGNMLLEHWKCSGLSIEGIRRHQDIETAVVCNVFDDKGEVAAGVASVQAIEKYLTPNWILKFKINVSAAPVMMVDANLSPPSLEASCQIAAQWGTPVWFEPVSVAKSKRIVSVAKYINFVSPNEDELIAMANALSGEDVFSPVKRGRSNTKPPPETLFGELKPAILVLLEKGIDVVVVTVGSDGVFLCSRGLGLHKLNLKKANPDSLSRQLYETVNLTCPANQFLNTIDPKGNSRFFAMHIPALSASVVRLAGAGDCLVGGTLASFCAGLDIIRSVAVGIAAAKAAVESETNVPEKYCLAKLADDARAVYTKSKAIFLESML